MSAYYEYMIWADVVQSVPIQDEEPVTKVQLSLFSRLVGGQRWGHVTRTDKIKTITDYVTTIVGGVTSCIIIPQTGLNTKFTPDEAMTLFAKAFIGKDNLICFRIPEDFKDSSPETEGGDVIISRADFNDFRDSLNRTLVEYSKDPDALFRFLLDLQGRMDDFAG